MDAQLSKEIEMLHSRVCYVLNDPKRIAILYELAQQPRYVGELAHDLSIPQPTISRHLKVLRERSLVKRERQGTIIYYSLTDERIIQALDLLRDILHDRLLADSISKTESRW